MNKELKPTFKLTCTELNVCMDAWVKNSEEYVNNGYRYGQHVCNWFKLSKMEGDNKKLEELLWEIKDLTGVLEALEYYNVIDYDN